MISLFHYFSNRYVWVTGYPQVCLVTYMPCVPTWGWSMWPSIWSSSAGWSTTSSSVIKWVRVRHVLFLLSHLYLVTCLCCSVNSFHCSLWPVSVCLFLCHTLTQRRCEVDTPLLIFRCFIFHTNTHRYHKEHSKNTQRIRHREQYMTHTYTQ